MTGKRLFSLLLFVAAAGVTPVAMADSVTFTLTNPVQSGPEGTVFTYTGTVTAPGTNTGTVYLNGDTPTVQGGPLTIDDTDFQNITVYSVDPGKTVTEDFFTVTATPGSAGTITTGVFELQGGSVLGASYDLLGSADFEADVTQATAMTTTPEPSSLWLLTTGATAGYAALRRRRVLTGAR